MDEDTCGYCYKKLTNNAATPFCNLSCERSKEEEKRREAQTKVRRTRTSSRTL